jgi:hypothetical protein
VRCPRILFALVLAILAVTLSGSALASTTDIYIAQNAAGGNTGADCADAHPVTWFNSSANWGTGNGQIGPGVTAHLCGTITGAAGTTMLTAAGSGASGNPIRILFESGGILTAPYWSASGAIVLTNRSFLTVDGGVNGQIVATTNGTAGSTLCTAGPCSTQQTSVGVNAMGCTNCEIKNLAISNMYVHDSSFNSNDTAVDQANTNAVKFLNTNSITVDHNTFHDCGWCINGWGNNIELAANEIYNTDHCFAIGPNANITNISVHDNHCHDFINWDTTSDAYHHDGLHIFEDSSHSVSGANIYNNLFDGNSGVNITAFFFTEGLMTGTTIYNNSFILQAGRTMTGLIWLTNNSNGTNVGTRVFNNFMNGTNSSICSAYKSESASGLTLQNNAFIGCPTLVDLEGTTTFASQGIGNNAYSSGSSQSFNWRGQTTGSFSVWKAELPNGSGQESQSIFDTVANLKIGPTGMPSAGSPVIGAAINLSGLGITPLDSDTSDGDTRTPSSRPGGSNGWDSGAYLYGNGGAPPAPPTGLSAVVQ